MPLLNRPHITFLVGGVLRDAFVGGNSRGCMGLMGVVVGRRVPVCMWKGRLCVKGGCW